MEISDLIKFGMTRTEAAVYLEMINLKESKIGEIIRRTQFHRGTVYNVLEGLIKKGFLASKITLNGKIYFITGNSIFNSILDKKQVILKEERRLLENFSKEIDGLKSDSTQGEIRIYKGKESYEVFYKWMIDECARIKEGYMVLGKGGTTSEHFGFAFFKMLQKYKKKKKVLPRIIHDVKSKLDRNRKVTVGHIKFLHYSQNVPSTTRIFSDYVSFTLWDTKPPVTILIKSKELNESYRSYFERLWKISKRYK